MITLVYDGTCTFCIRSLDRLKRADVNHDIELVDAHAPALLERFPQLRDARLDNAMYSIDERGRVRCGFDAFRAAFGRLPYAALWVWLLDLPGIAHAGRAVYAYVARNRHKFGCEGTCGLTPP